MLIFISLERYYFSASGSFYGVQIPYRNDHKLNNKVFTFTFDIYIQTSLPNSFHC